MLWIIMGRDVPDSTAARLAARPAHLERLQALHDEGRLRLAGPIPNDPDSAEAGIQGSLIIADFPNRAEATQWAEQDPYCAAKVYASVEVQAFRQVLP